MSFDGKGFRIGRVPIGTVRSTLILAAIIFFVAEFGYLSGYGAIRYKDPINDPWMTWVYWRYWIAAVLPILTTVATWMLAFDYQGRRSSPAFHMFVCIVTTIYLVVFIGWEVVVWTQCNNFTGPNPDHPHCINREFPFKTLPDPAFFLTFGGAGLNLLVILFYLFYSNQMACMATAGNQITPIRRADDEDAFEEDDDQPRAVLMKIGNGKQLIGSALRFK